MGNNIEKQVEKEVQRQLLVCSVVVRRELPNSPSKDTLLEYLENRAVPATQERKEISDE